MRLLELGAALHDVGILPRNPYNRLQHSFCSGANAYALDDFDIFLANARTDEFASLEFGEEARRLRQKRYQEKLVEWGISKPQSN